MPTKKAPATRHSHRNWFAAFTIVAFVFVAVKFGV